MDPAPNDEKKMQVEEGKKQISGIREYLENKSQTFFKKRKVAEKEIDRVFKKREEIKKKTSNYQRRRNLVGYIEKAGLDLDPQKVPKMIFFSALGITFLLLLIMLTRFILAQQSVAQILMVSFAVAILGFIVIWLLLWLAFEIYLDVKMFRRKLEMEEVLPDFLQLASANIRAGMSIDRALWFAVRPRFGVLAKEIENVAKRTLSGEELETALLDFGNKYDSPLLLKEYHLLNEGMAAGGDIGDLLNKIALNIMELRTMGREMSANVTTYVIFITFASIVAAPVLFTLSHQLLNIVQGITKEMDSSGDKISTKGIPISIKGGNINPNDYMIFVYTALTMSSLFSGIIVSTIKKGNIKESAQYLPLFVICALIVFVLSDWLFSSIFGSMF